MKSKIISLILCLAAIAATVWLVQNPPADLRGNGETETQEETAPESIPVQSNTRTAVINTAHDTEDFFLDLAYGKLDNYQQTLDGLIPRVEQSADFLKNELKEYYGATYFTKIASILQDLRDTPFADAASFGARAGKILNELESTYPAQIAASLNENDPHTPMYYPKFDTDVNGSTTLALLALYRTQYAEKTGSILITCGGNLMMGDTLLGAEAQNSFKNKQENSTYPYPLFPVASLLQTDDASFANLTSPFTESIEMDGVAGAVKGLPSYSTLMKNGGMECVSLVDKKMLSYGETGIKDTKTALTQAGISYSEMGTIAYQDTELGKIAFLSYNIIEHIQTNVNQAYTEAPKTDIAAAKLAGAKFVVVNFNWITTETREWDVCRGQYATARAAIDNGADLVFGTGTDSIAPIELYNGKTIVYSAGNLYNRQGEAGSPFLYQQAFTLDDKGNAVPGEIQIIPLIGTTGENALPSIVLDETGVNQFKTNIVKASSLMRNGVGKNSFPTSMLNLITVKK